MFATKYEPAWAVQANNVQKLSLFHRENIHFPSNLQTFYFPSIAFESSLPLHALVMSGLLFNFQLDLLIKEKCALPQWCKLTETEMNIYVMRMMFFCLLTLSMVYRFWLIICFWLRELSLKANIRKSSYILFERNRCPIQREVFIDVRKLDQVSGCVYLGFTVTENMSLIEDVEWDTSTFLRQFNIILFHQDSSVVQGSNTSYIFTH